MTPLEGIAIAAAIAVTLLAVAALIAWREERAGRRAYTYIRDHWRRQ